MSTPGKSVEELIIDDQEFLIARQRISAEKHALQAQLTELNNRFRTHLPSAEYRKLMGQRTDLVKALGEKEQEFAELKLGRAEINARIGIAKVNGGMKVARVRDLVELRDRWHGFSMEASNHQKAREAAWKFSQELRAILKLHFDGTV